MCTVWFRWTKTEKPDPSPADLQVLSLRSPAFLDGGISQSPPAFLSRRRCHLPLVGFSLPLVGFSLPLVIFRRVSCRHLSSRASRGLRIGSEREKTSRRQREKTRKPSTQRRESRCEAEKTQVHEKTTKSRRNARA